MSSKRSATSSTIPAWFQEYQEKRDRLDNEWRQQLLKAINEKTQAINNLTCAVTELLKKDKQ